MLLLHYLTDKDEFIKIKSIFKITETVFLGIVTENSTVKAFFPLQKRQNAEKCLSLRSVN